MKQSLCTTLVSKRTGEGRMSPVTANGSGDNLRVSVFQVVHHGVKAVQDRGATLVLDPAEALLLAESLLGAIPFGYLERSDALPRVRKMLEVLDR